MFVYIQYGIYIYANSLSQIHHLSIKNLLQFFLDVLFHFSPFIFQVSYITSVPTNKPLTKYLESSKVHTFNTIVRKTLGKINIFVRKPCVFSMILNFGNNLLTTPFFHRIFAPLRLQASYGEIKHPRVEKNVHGIWINIYSVLKF